MLQRFDFPVRRNTPEPFDAGILHGNARGEAPGDRLRDEGSSPLLEQLDQPLLLRHQTINPRRLASEKGRNRLLLGSRWHRYRSSLQVTDIDAADGCPKGACFQLSEDGRRLERMKQPGSVSRRCVCDACSVLREVCALQFVWNDRNLTDAPRIAYTRSPPRSRDLVWPDSISNVVRLRRSRRRRSGETSPPLTMGTPSSTFGPGSTMPYMMRRSEGVELPDALDLPMRRNLPQPLDAGVFVRRIWLRIGAGSCRPSRVLPSLTTPSFCSSRSTRGFKRLCWRASLEALSHGCLWGAPSRCISCRPGTWAASPIQSLGVYIWPK